MSRPRASDHDATPLKCDEPVWPAVANSLVVKERLGHGSITTTEQYLQTLPNAHDQTLEALRVVRGQPKPRAGEGAPT